MSKMVNGSFVVQAFNALIMFFGVQNSNSSYNFMQHIALTIL